MRIKSRISVFLLIACIWLFLTAVTPSNEHHDNASNANSNPTRSMRSLPNTQNIFIKSWKTDDYAVALKASRSYLKDPNSLDAWTKLGFPTSNPARTQPSQAVEQYRLFNAAPPKVDCAPLERWGQGSAKLGSGDGGKILCNLNQLQAGCMIYSLGSNNDFSFEESMLKNTPCEIHTFDCTVDGSTKPNNPRVVFHHLCIGPDTHRSSLFRTLSSITEELGHTRISLLKMDIEGGEYGVFQEFHNAMTHPNPAVILPDQISFELHSFHQYNPPPPGRPKNMNVVWPLLTELGYVVISREDNTLAFHCVEFTLIRAFV